MKVLFEVITYINQSGHTRSARNLIRCDREENNANDKFAVKLVRNDGNKEHVPIELSKVFKFFLKEVSKYLQL